jgi:hypothetical protein
MPISTTIDSAAALYALMTTTNAGDLAQSYIQTADIDMSSYGNPSKSIAGTETSTPYDFAGTYDGQGYTITIGNVVSDYTGLFDSVATPGIVKNVNVIYNNALSLSVSGTNFNNTWGGLVGALTVSSVSNCSVTFNNTVSVTALATAIPMGLLCGFMGQNSSISNSQVIINSAINIAGADNSNIGLICGQSGDSTITDCSVTSSSSSYNISLTVNDSSTGSDYSSIGLVCGFFGTNFTQLNQPLLKNITINLNNTGNVTLNNISVTPGTTYIGAICGTLDGDSTAGSTDAINCIVNINNNQTLVAALNDFGQLVDNATITNSLFTWTTTTDNTLLNFTTTRPSPAVSVKYVNSITNTYNLPSGNYYIPNTTSSLIVGPETLSLQSQTSPAGIIINGILYSVGTKYASSNIGYAYTINVKGVGSMYFDFDITGITSDPLQCICQVNNYPVNPQTGVTEDSRITNIVQDKTIRSSIDREFAAQSVIYPKFKSYSDYIKYLQGGLKY